MTFESNIPVSANVEVSIAAIDNKGKYKNLPPDVGLKTAKLVEELQKLKVFENQAFGTTIEITENKVYLKTEAGLIEALTIEEAQEKFPEVQKIMDSMARTLQQDIKVDPKEQTPVKGGIASAVKREKKLPVKSRLIVEVKFLHGSINNVNEITSSLHQTKPDLAAAIIEKADELNKLEKKASKAEEEEGYIEETELTRKIVDARKELYVLLEAGKTAIYAEKVLKGIVPYAFEYRGEGKAKEVHDIVGLTTVAIIPRGGAMETITGSREKEIIGEVATSERIKRALYEAPFVELFEKMGFKDPEATTEKLLNQYTRSELIRIFQSRDHNALWVVADIDKLEAAQLLHYRDAILEVLEQGKNIAFEYKLLGRLIEGKLTYEAPAAECDLEEFIRRGIDFPTKMSIVAQILAGMRDLHASGHAHGDLKAENILVYKVTLPNGKTEYIVKIADFGKTREIKPGESLFYSGNARHEAPEKRLSFKSEDYGTAMIIARVLEDDLLNPKTEMMIEPSQGVKLAAPRGVRRGIEKYVTENALTYQREASGLSGKVLAFSPRAAPTLFKTADALKAAENEVQRYIAILVQKLADANPSADRDKLAGLESLLKDMMLSDPAKRPTMKEAYERFQATGLSQPAS